MPKLISIYTTPTCPYCKLAKAMFKEKGIAYTEYDVGSDSAKADEMIKLSEQMGVPVIVVDGKVIVGFDKPAIEKALG